MGFSLITAVYGIDKLHYIEKLFKSLMDQNADLECIVVDQNKTDEVKDLCDQYNSNLVIKYVRLEIPGLSRARNAGLKVATHDIIAFPDDDCEFSKGILKNVNDFFLKNKKYQIFICEVRETTKKYKLAFTGIDGEKELGYDDIFIACCSISIFHLNKFTTLFDEEFGMGGQYNSCEDYDYVLSMMKEGGNVFFSDKLHMLHPDSQSLKRKILYKKIQKNSIGHGAYFRKHFSLLWKSALYHLASQMIGAIIYIFALNIHKSYSYYISFKSRLRGFFLYIKK